jgi:prepilin-type N-terminal cleavage/methylation domain-containing protein
MLSSHSSFSPCHSEKSKGFTLIELLVVIAIIAILSVVVILTLNPAELLRQSRDSSRVSDMATLSSALGIYSEDVGGGMGSPNVVYVSIPDPSATSTAGDQCQGLGLISLPSLYSYHCAASSTYRNVDGTGWIPVNFKSISSGAPVGSLPIDPFNTSSSRLYYTYTTDGTQYEVTSGMESSKYKLGGSNDVISSDGGPLASVYEKGSKLGLEPLDYGDPFLVGLWTFDEGSGTVAYDYSGNNTTGSWNGTPAGNNGTYYTGGKVGNYAGAFDGNSTYILDTKTINIPTVTVSAWINISSYPTMTYRIAGFASGIGGDGHDKEIYINSNGKLFFYIFDTNGIYTPVPSSSIPLNQWVYAVGTADGTTARAFVNGNEVASIPAGNTYIGYSSPDILIGGNSSHFGYFKGLIDDVRIYNRALSAAEIQAMYNAQK